jgi:pimeloyl-ACP methyl ester carboxylesterase
MTVRTDTLEVPGASLYYKVRGSGPILLVLQGGPADADGSDGIAGYLADRYTVVSYDRRGLSRSRLHPGAPPPIVQTHADDAHHLLSALTSEPAVVTGISIGALIGLDLVARYPRQVRTLISHEPPVPALLPEPDRSRAFQQQEEAEEIFRREGAPAAMKHFITITGADFNDREPDMEMPRRTPQMAMNAAFFLTHDAPSVRLYELDVAALKAASTRIIPAAGRTSRHIWTHHAARELAARLGTDLVEFPGGHSGYGMHPRAFAALLAQCAAHTVQE